LPGILGEPGDQGDIIQLDSERGPKGGIGETGYRGEAGEWGEFGEPGDSGVYGDNGLPGYKVSSKQN
jgi:hypothetical protein